MPQTGVSERAGAMEGQHWSRLLKVERMSQQLEEEHSGLSCHKQERRQDWWSLSNCRDMRMPGGWDACMRWRQDIRGGGH